jgi:hypothetical protein
MQAPGRRRHFPALDLDAFRHPILLDAMRTLEKEADHSRTNIALIAHMFVCLFVCL